MHFGNQVGQTLYKNWSLAQAKAKPQQEYYDSLRDQAIAEVDKEVNKRLVGVR